ncbi:winged helix-turn-helix domain-containing protein [Dyella telluris]|uniref:Transcriptional regulator n=1 Tax=Dyella telluris TaxID=2763498 RepID=A0A7G8Q9T0_9GAMM|nr:transcriptional regulator [Dyella telluris]QNK03538.1 transcriptional regulator [Dyella telluris]
MAQSHPDCGWIYHCDDILVEPRAHRLERAGETVSVEPKAYAVLVVLLQQAGEVVGKDALLDAAWGHRHVTPGVLTRVISQLRHALGDNVSQPRYIATVHSLGYRFIGDVHRSPSATAPANEPLPDIASNDDLAPAPPLPMLPPAPSSEPPRRWVAAAITLAVIVAVLAAVSLWHTPNGHTSEQHVTPQPALAVMPVAHEQDLRPIYLHRHARTHRLATGMPGDHDDAPAGPRAAGYLTLRPEQAPVARA